LPALRCGPDVAALTEDFTALAHVTRLLLRRIEVVSSARSVCIRGPRKAARTIVSLHLVRIDHAEHLGEALPDASNTLRGVSEGHFSPGEELNLLAIKVGQILLTAGARIAAQVLLVEHGIFVLRPVLLAHHQVIQILELSLQKLQSFLCLDLIRKFV
jgi:hypothetical protein